jgi:hypothetical protein
MFRHPLVVVIAALSLGACQRQSDNLPTWEAWAEAFSLPSDELNGWVDTEYRFDNRHPAYQDGSGPVVCVDEAHFNRQTAAGLFKPLAELLRGDGYRIARFRSRFTANALEDCQILLISNAQARANTIGWVSPASNWAYPHASALAREEIDDIVLWVRGGGALLLIADHAPLPAAVSDLALLLGAHMLDGYAYASAPVVRGFGSGEIVFGTVNEETWRQATQRLWELSVLELAARFEPVLASPGVLAPHPVVEGRRPGERVDWVVTFTGQAFLTTGDWDPIMILGPNAVSLVPWVFNADDAEWGDGPLFSAAGWLQGATRKVDRGRVAVLGEGGMCTAQLDDLDGEISGPQVPSGFNAPHAPQNAQFCLNLVRWLSGLLDELLAE